MAATSGSQHQHQPQQQQQQQQQQQGAGAGAGDQQQRASSRFSNDWASYMHLQNQLETAEPDPTVIVVKKKPPVSKRPSDPSVGGSAAAATAAAAPPAPEFLGLSAAALEPRLREPGVGIGDRRSAATAVTSLTDEMSEYGEDEVVLSAATRVGLKRSPSSGAAIVFNKASISAASAPGPPSPAESARDRDSSTKQSFSQQRHGYESGPGTGFDPATLANAGIVEGATPSRTSIGEDSVNRHRNSNPSRFSNGTSGWQTPSETQSQQSPRSSRSARPLTLPPAEPLPPLPSPNSNTPHLPAENGAGQTSPELSHQQRLTHSSSSGRLASQAAGTGLGSPPSSISAASTSRPTKALGIEIRPPAQQGGTSPGHVNRIRAAMETALGGTSPSAPLSPRSPAQPAPPRAAPTGATAAAVSAREREFMERIDRSSLSADSSASVSTTSMPAHMPITAATGRLNGESTSTVTSPVTPTAATMSTSTSSGSTMSRATERVPPSAAGKAQAIFAATNGGGAAASTSRNPLAGARTAASEQVHGNRTQVSIIEPEGRGLVRRASSVNLQSRRNEMEEDKVIVKSAPQQRAVILKKAETRFAGAFNEVAQAFKQLQAEKRTLENIIRATTPLDGLGDQGQLSDYLKSMTAKVASNEEEIRKLLELLDQQRAVMDYMLETHEREADAHFDQIDELQVQLDIMTEEAENHRANCVQLTADLERAHNDSVSARADVLKLRAALQQEASKCEQAMTLLRAVQHQMKDRDQANKLVREELETLRARQDDRRDARGRDEDMQTKLSAQHAEELSSLSEELRRDLSSKHEADLLARSEQIRAELAAKHADELERFARQLRTELAAQHKSELKTLQAKLESNLMLAKAEAKERLSQKNNAHESELKALHSRLGRLEREGDNKATLEGELRDMRAQQVTLVNQLAERTNAMNEMEDKSRGLEKEVGVLRAATAVPPALPDKDGDRSAAALQMRLQAAEARAAAAEKEKEEMQIKMTALEEGGSKSELASLRAQLVDQRAREVQIRNAYKNLQYELRKAQQSFKADDRKRSFLTGMAGGSGGSVSGHGAPLSSLDGPPTLQRSSSNSSQTNRQLKRLSLPVQPKGDRVLPTNWMDIYQRESMGGGGGGGGGGSRPTSASSTHFSHFGNNGPPPSSFRQPVSASRNSFSFSTTPSPPDRRRSGGADGAGGGADEEGRSLSSAGTASHAGGVLGYGSANSNAGDRGSFSAGGGANGNNAIGMTGMSASVSSSSSSSSSATAANNYHGQGQQMYGRPVSEASAYSISEEDEEVMESDGGTSGMRTKDMP
ncbi:hypothetical protein OC844_002831 [Tilletia horrida]|nr:hypothetical protein OC844_002831 [Tilletia horrida]